MNVYRMLKGLDQIVKDVPKTKASQKKLLERHDSLDGKLNTLQSKVNTLQSKVDDLQSKVNTPPPKEPTSFQDNWPNPSLPLPSPATETKSSLCKQADFLTAQHLHWCKLIKEEPRFHRKMWEFCYILESLHQRGMIAEGRKGLGFAVGTEPLPALFASFGCEILATDLHPEQGTEKGWTTGDQLCFGLDDLNKRGICAKDKFEKLCSYRAVDMNHIPEDLEGFDFNWSSCSFEHLGSIEKGLTFVKNQLKTLKPGGWAVHTTEYNLSSNDETLEDPNCVIFRQRDIEKVIGELRAEGHYVAELDFSLGWLPFDYKVDTPPYAHLPHLRLQLANFVCTSIGLIIRKKS